MHAHITGALEYIYLPVRTLNPHFQTEGGSEDKTNNKHRIENNNNHHNNNNNHHNNNNQSSSSSNSTSNSNSNNNSSNNNSNSNSSSSSCHLRVAHAGHYSRNAQLVPTLAAHAFVSVPTDPNGHVVKPGARICASGSAA